MPRSPTARWTEGEAGANATNSMLVDDAAVSGATVGDRIITSGATTDSAVANSVVDGNAAVKSTDTLDSSIDAANAGNAADAAESKFKNLGNTLAFEDLDRGRVYSYRCYE